MNWSMADVMAYKARRYPSRASVGTEIREHDLQMKCEDELKRMGIWYLHIKKPRMNKAGVPDLVFAMPGSGRFCGIELKSDKGKESKKQRETIAWIKSNGGYAEVVRSYERFLEILNIKEP